MKQALSRIQELASKSVEDLAEIPRLGQKTAQQLIDQAKEWIASMSESESLPEVETAQEEDQTEQTSSAEEVMEPEAASEAETDSEEEAEKTTLRKVSQDYEMQQIKVSDLASEFEMRKCGGDIRT